jgi:hypothetical protein
VAGLLQRAAGDALAGPAASRLVDAALLDAARHLQVIAAAQRLGKLLDNRGEPWVVLKGPVLVETAYGGVPRPYFDMDLLVAPPRFPAVLEALEGAGAHLIDRNWELLIRDGRAEVSLTDRPTGLTVDLHWHLVNLGRVRRTFSVPTEDLLERRVNVELRSVVIPALERTDRLIHYALHAATSGGHRLIWLADLARVIMNDPPDWDELIHRARSWKVGLPVAVILARVEATLGVAPPSGVVPSLAGNPAARWLTERLAVWEPGGRLPGGGSIRHGVTESLAGSFPATAGLVARNGGEMVRRFWDRHPHWLDPDDPAHIEHDAGGAAARERYLARVGAGEL